MGFVTTILIFLVGISLIGGLISGIIVYASTTAVQSPSEVNHFVVHKAFIVLNLPVVIILSIIALILMAALVLAFVIYAKTCEKSKSRGNIQVSCIEANTPAIENSRQKELY